MTGIYALKSAMRKRIKTNHKIIIREIYEKLYKTFGPQHWWPGDSAFEIAVGAVLTQNTNWGNVKKAISNLKQHKVLNSKTLQKMPDLELSQLIKSAGYYNVKTKRLKNFLHFLNIHYNGRIKNMRAENTGTLREKLLQVNGIGPETADSILLYCLARPVFVIDAYTKRILHRHGIISEKAGYEELQKLFHSNLKQAPALFNEFHALIVRLGKDYCRKKPRCGECPLKGTIA